MKYIFVSEKIDLDNIDLDEVMMIGDSISADIVGAKKMGIKTCWYNHRNIQTQLAIDCVADYMVKDLYEFMNIDHV